jgi:hypothetical protein
MTSQVTARDDGSMTTTKSKRSTAADVWGLLEVIGWIVLVNGAGSLVSRLFGGEYKTIELMDWMQDRQPAAGIGMLLAGLAVAWICHRMREAAKARHV